MATGRCSDGACRNAAKTRMPMIAPTATTIAAISNARGGPSRGSASFTAQTLGAHSAGDRAGQGAGDAGDPLDARNDVGLQVGEVVGADADHDVVRARDVLRGQHT